MNRENAKMFKVVPYLESLRKEFESCLDVRFREELDERDSRMTNLQLDCNGVLIQVQRKHSASARLKIDLKALTNGQEDREHLSHVAEQVGVCGKR